MRVSRHGLGVFARGLEFHRRRTLLRQLQIDPARRQIDQLAGGIQCQIRRVLVAELFQLALIIAVDPARGGDLHLLENRLDAVFVLEPVSHHVELQRADCAQDQIVAHQRAEELGRASSLNCSRPFCSCLSLSGSRRRARRNSSGAKLGMPVKASFSPSVKVSPMATLPWWWMPITSPGQASPATSRSEAMNVSALASFISLPLRTCSTFMPPVKCPEHTRMNAHGRG